MKTEINEREKRERASSIKCKTLFKWERERERERTQINTLRMSWGHNHGSTEDKTNLMRILCTTLCQ